MKIKTFILTFLMMMSCPFLFGQSTVTPKTYGSLKTALSGELGTNVTITLASDINVTETIEIPTTVTATLDLNGYKLTTAEDKYAFNNMGKLTIEDPKGTGSIETRGIYNGNQGSVGETTLEAVLTIKGGIFKAIGTNGGAAIYNLGTTVIEGGEFYGYYAALHNRLAKMTIENAYIEAYDHNAFAAMRNSGELIIGENVLLAGNYNHEGEATKTGDFKVVVAKINDKPYVQFTDVINDIENMSGDVTVKLYQDVTMDITAWQTLAIGGDNTTKITIDGENGDNDFTLTFNKLNSDWNHIATSNDNATALVLKNMTITDSGYNNGPWNRYDLVFASDVELHNVNATKALAFKAGATLNNVSITDSNDVYAIWVQANGQEINIDGLNINAGRGIKIDEQYVTAQNVSLSVANATFTTAKKAAIVIKSAAETEITVGENVNITNVAADNTNIAWVDTDAAVNYGNVTVTGGTLAQEDSDDFYAAHVDNEGNIVSYFKTLQEAVNAANGKTIVLVQDYTNDVTISQEEGKNIIIDGKEFDFSGTIYIEGNSLFEGEETLTIQNFNFTTEEAEHNFIASDFRLTDDLADDQDIRYAHNVTVKDCNFTATKESTAVVAMRFRQAYNINVEDCKFENMFLGMWATGVSGVNVTKVMALSCKEGGFSFGQSTNIVVDDATIVASTGYGIRVDASVSTTLTVNKSRLTAKIPVVGRNVTPTADYTMIFSGDNEMAELNSHDKWLVVGKEDYTTNGYELPNIADSKVKVELNKEDNLNINGVYGAYQAIAKIGEVRYAFLQDAINAVAATEGEHTITMIGTSIEDENVTVPQTPDVAITINGNNQNYRGTITVDGGSAAYETAALTIKNFSFNAYSISKDAVINLGGTNPTRYTNHVTIENCDFRGNDANKNKVAVKSYTGGCENLTITECTATGLHSLAQLYTTAGVTVEGCEITNSKSGISLAASSGVSISDVTMDVEKYGIRVDAGSAVTTKISDCDIKAYVPVIARKATGNYAFEFNGNNTMTPANPDGKFCVVDGGNNDYEDGDVNLEDLAAPTGFVMVTLNDANLSYEGVYGGHTHEAKIGDTRYVFLQYALDAVEAGEQPTTIEIIRDVTSDATVSQVEGENIIIDGKGFDFSGTIYIEGNSRFEGEETLTIQNFNFTTGKDSHDFISSNSTESAKRYAHNVTVKDCNFTATKESTAVVGMRFRQAYNINVEGGKFANLHSVMWTSGTSGATVKGIVATGCKEGGISFGTSTDLAVENSTIVAMGGYGIRVGGNGSESLGGPITITGPNYITAKIPVLVRNANNDSKVTFVGENTITELNSNNDYYCVIGAGEYDGGANLPAVATGNVIVDLTESNLSYEGVYGNFAVAKIGNVQYSTFAAALEAAQKDETIELIYKEGDDPIAMNGALYGKNVTVTGTATVDWSKGWLYIGRGGEGDAQLTFNNANLTSASDTKKYGINVSGKAADGHAYDGTLRIEGHSNIEVDYIITRNRLVVVNASTLTAKNGFVLGGRPATETVNDNDATASVFLTNNAHIIVNGNKTTIGYEGKATIDLSTGGTSFKCYDHNVTITDKGIVNLDGATFNVTGENAVELANNGTVNVKGNSSLNIQKLTGNAINFNNVTIADAYIGGAVNAFGTNNISGTSTITGFFSVGYNEGNYETPVTLNITGDFNGANVAVGNDDDQSINHVLNVGVDDVRTKAYFGQLIANTEVNIKNADVTRGYTLVRGKFNVTNSAIELAPNAYNTYLCRNAEVVIDNSTFALGAYANIGSLSNSMDYPNDFGNTNVILKNGSSMTATNLSIDQADERSVKVTIEDNSRLEATTNLTNQGSIVLASVDAKVTSEEFDNAPTTTVPYKKVGYVDGSYVVIDKDYVAQIIDAEGNLSPDRRYESFAEAVEAALNGETIELLWNEGDNAIAMAAALNGKTITVTGDANVDWSKGFLFVGRGDAQGNNADATLIFDKANLTSEPANSSTGLNVSGYEIDEEITNRTGNVIMNNSNIVVEYLLNAGNITLNNTTLKVNDGFRISGRTADETQGVIGTATFNLFNSTVIVDNMNGMPIGYKGIGIMNIDENSTLQCLRDYGVDPNGKMNIAGSVVIADGKKLTNNGEININGGNVSVTSIVNAGTINVTGASVLSATVTGEGSVNMNDVALTETTNFVANNINFAGENGNSITGAKIEANGNAIVKDVKLEVNAGSDLDFNKLTVNKQLSISRGKLRVTHFVNDGITSINYEESDVYVFGSTTNNNVLNISNKAVYKTDQFINNSENLNVSSNSRLEIRAAKFAANSNAKVAGEIYVSGSVVQEENAVISLTDAAAKFTTTNTGLNVVTGVAHSKVVYTDGAYVVVAKHYVAYIGETGYETLQDAFDAAETGATIVLFNDKVSVIPMNANLYGKNVTITTEGKEVTVDWNTNGNYWLFVGRGGEGNATLTFDNAKLTSVSNNGGIHVSGREKDATDKYDGTLIIKNSEIELTEFINRNVVTVENSTVTTTLLTSHGRPAGETENGEDATATFTLTNSTLNAQKITNGNEGFGVMTVDAKSNINVSEEFNVTKGQLFSAGNITGNLKEEVEDAIELTAGVYTVDVREYCAEGYGAFYNDEYKTWTVRMTYGVQETSLAKGWNWFSSYINLSTNDGLEKIQTALGTSGIEIKGKYNNNMSECEDLGDGTYAWFGDFTPSAEQMYMINTSDAVTMNIEGDVVDYTNVAIVLNSGWNWIGYPLYETVEINDALANLTNVASGDEIKSLNNGYAQYSARLKRWSGTLTTLIPGEGYMYKSSNATSFVYSVGSKRSSDNNVNVVENYYWTPNVSEYSNNMTITAMLSIDNELVNDNYEIAAFANGECRGNARPVYIDELDSYVLFMNIRGNDVEELTFKYYDVNYGTEYVLDNRINYSNDAVVGTIDEPYMFNLSILNVDEATISEVNIYPNPTTTGTEISLNATCDKVEVFNALGVKVAEYQNVDSIDAIETAGIYVIRITNDSNVQNCRLVVK